MSGTWLVYALLIGQYFYVGLFLSIGTVREWPECRQQSK